MRLQGERMMALNGSFRSISCTLNPSETTLGTPEALPTSEPGTSQVIYTLADGHKPTWSGGEPYSYGLHPIVFIGGQNTTGSSLTVYWRAIKNSVSQHTGSASVAANYYWTLTSTHFGSVCIVGDVLEMRVWASASGANWSYKAIYLLPTRILPVKPRHLMTNVTAYGTIATLSSGSRAAWHSMQRYYDDINMGSYYDSTISYTAYVCGQSYGLGRVYGDQTPGVHAHTSATALPYRRDYFYIYRVDYRWGPDL